MSEDFHHESSSKLLSKCTHSIEYFNEINVETESSEEEINVVDHMYATNIENGDINDLSNESPPINCQTAESEVKLIKEWLILHTDLIQQQNDDILDKDREIYILRKENEMLKERINCIEKGIPFQLDKPSNQVIEEEVIVEDMTQGSLKEGIQEGNKVIEEQYCPSDNCSQEVLAYKDENCVNISECESQLNNSVILTEKNYQEPIVNTVIELKNEVAVLNAIDSWKSNSDFLSDSIPVTEYSFSVNNISEFDPMKNLRMSIRRKRVKSCSSGLSHNESLNLEEKETYRRRFKKKKRRLTKDANILTSLDAYITQAHEVNLGIPTIELDITECLATSLEVSYCQFLFFIVN
ncbi:unnamed protein product [Psylliodes chrysocephalus]|uniref:Uncharacterized protein n=1 Tax=Psylliodes chrysocephalus TaxID=3402493 RepID=A0A9P0D889_9CUCU|nr:unnamed protein product [Psylliodes chrysocephala]